MARRKSLVSSSDHLPIATINGACVGSKPGPSQGVGESPGLARRTPRTRGQRKEAMMPLDDEEMDELDEDEVETTPRAKSRVRR